MNKSAIKESWGTFHEAIMLVKCIGVAHALN